jgi:hypothetical protein
MPAFENALMLVADTKDPAQAVPDRNAVVGQSSSTNNNSGNTSGGNSGSGGGSGDAGEWFGQHSVVTLLDRTPSTAGWDYWWAGEFDVGPGARYHVLVGLDLNHAWWSDPTSSWGKWWASPTAILSAGMNPNGTNQFGSHSMWYGAETLKEVGALMDTWRQNFTQWAHSVDSEGSDFQGSAAGVFHSTLMSFANVLGAISSQLADPTLVNQLASLENVMTSQAQNLLDAFQSWASTPENMPNIIVRDLFQQETAGMRVHYHMTGLHGMQAGLSTTNGGDPTQQAWWSELESKAKQQWLSRLSSLDSAAQNFLSTLDSAYQKTSTMMPTSFSPPPVLTPPPPPNNGNNINLGNLNLGNLKLGGNTGGNGPPNVKLGNLNGNGGGSGGGGAKVGNTQPKVNLGGLNGNGSGGSGGTGGPNGLGNLNNLFTNGGTGGTNNPNVNLGNLNSTGNGGGQNVLLGSNGQPLTGGTNNPNVNLGNLNSTGNGSGQNVLLGPNGQPLTDGNGNPINVPQGSTIGPNGAVIGPDGQPITGPNGQPLRVPSGSSIGGAASNNSGPNNLSSNLSPNLSPNPKVNLSGLNGGGLGGSGLGNLKGGVSNNLFGGSLQGGGGAGGGGGGGSFGRLLSSNSGMSNQAKNMFDPVTNEPGQNGGGGTNPSLAENLATQEQNISRVATVGGNTGGQNEPPMMPPMGGMGGGAGGGGSGGGKKTWVTEDEETWGTTAAGTGVLGR